MSNPRYQPNIYNGELRLIELQMPPYFHNQMRTIRIYLPANYDENNPQKRFPVLYMHDGQNLFDAATSFAGEWEIDETISDFVEKGHLGCIVIGIDNSPNRLNELSPVWKRKWFMKNKINSPCGDEYAKFIVDVVKPYIDQNFHTLPERKHTGIGGSSMGGIISFYMALKYADVFSYGIIFSPAISLYPRKTWEQKTRDLLKNIDNPPLLYLYTGGLEKAITRSTKQLNQFLLENAYPRDNFAFSFDQEASHNEKAWSKHFVHAYQWWLDHNN